MLSISFDADASTLRPSTSRCVEDEEYLPFAKLNSNSRLGGNLVSNKIRTLVLAGNLSPIKFEASFRILKIDLANIPSMDFVWIIAH